MKSLLNALRAEAIKTRRTFLGKSPVLFPFLVVLFPFIAFATSGVEQLVAKAASGAGGEFAAGCMVGWIYMMLPFFALQIALMIFHTEHTQNMWKHLNALPMPGRIQVLAKHLMGSWQLLAGTLCFMLQILLALVLLKAMRPELGIRFDLPTFWWALGRHTLLCQAAGLMILLPLMVVAARFRNIGVTLTTGIFGFAAAFFVKPTDTLAAFFPWSMGKVWIARIMDPNAPRHLWWVLPALGCVALSVGVHLFLQRRKPLY